MPAKPKTEQTQVHLEEPATPPEPEYLADAHIGDYLDPNEHWRHITHRANSVYKKLAAIRDTCVRVPKNGWNAHGNYAYVLEEDMLAAVRAEMVAQCVYRAPVEILSSGDAKEARSSLRTRWIDLETGDYHEVVTQGFDVNGGNKASWSSHTGALKYELRHMFFVSTGEDPETVGSSEPREGSRRGSPSPAGPAGQGASSRPAPAAPPASATRERAPLNEADWMMLEAWAEMHTEFAAMNCYSEYGLSFAESLVPKIKQYKRNAFVSPKQLEVAHKIYEEARVALEEMGK